MRGSLFSGHLFLILEKRASHGFVVPNMGGWQIEHLQAECLDSPLKLVLGITHPSHVNFKSQFYSSQ